MKKLKSCANGDGRPIQPPSLVLCKECFDKLDAKFAALADRLASLSPPPAHLEEEP